MVSLPLFIPLLVGGILAAEAEGAHRATLGKGQLLTRRRVRWNYRFGIVMLIYFRLECHLFHFFGEAFLFHNFTKFNFLVSDLACSFVKLFESGGPFFVRLAHEKFRALTELGCRISRSFDLFAVDHCLFGLFLRLCVQGVLVITSQEVFQLFWVHLTHHFRFRFHLALITLLRSLVQIFDCTILSHHSGLLAYLRNPGDSFSFLDVGHNFLLLFDHTLDTAHIQRLMGPVQ